jgi:hypothetical protein
MWGNHYFGRRWFADRYWGTRVLAATPSPGGPLARVQCCITPISISAGETSVPVSNVVDRDGEEFAGKLFLVMSGNVAFNTLGYQTGLNNGFADYRGIATPTAGMAHASADIARFGGKICSDGGASGYSVLDLQADVFFGGNFQRRGYITDVQVGAYRIALDLNNRDGDVVIAVIGGDDLAVDAITSALFNGTFNTSAAPVGLLALSRGAGISETLSAVIGAGSSPMLWGWDTKESGRGCAAYVVGNQSGNSRVQLSDRFAAVIDTSSISGGVPVVEAWGQGSYSVSGATGTLSVQQVAFGGTGVKCAAGAFRLPAVDGQVTVDLGIDASFVMGMSIGAPPTTSLLTGEAHISYGWTDGQRQGGLWAGESTVGNVGSIDGARYLMNANLLRFGTADGGSTTLHSTCSIVSLTRAGQMTLNCVGVDGTEPEVLWFALGQEIFTGTPVVPWVRRVTRHVIRRLRRSPHVKDDFNWLFFKRFELAMETGVGLQAGQGVDPQVMLRWSDDGGRTWSYEHWQSAGRMGQYAHIVQWQRLGRSEDRIWEVCITDPVKVRLLDAYIDAGRKS